MSAPSASPRLALRYMSYELILLGRIMFFKNRITLNSTKPKKDHTGIEIRLPPNPPAMLPFKNALMPHIPRHRVKNKFFPRDLMTVLLTYIVYCKNYCRWRS
jgi:hypothetical protein